MSNDTVDELIEYINEIKPYHTKVTEIVEVFTITENITITVEERLLTETK
jgi:hypothetical protein